MTEIDIQLRDKPLDPETLRRAVSHPAAGAETLFVGTVRDHSSGKTVRRLEFEAYKAMAIRELRKIVDTARARWPICRVVVHHRIGQVEVGGIAVVIAVSTPHRVEGFESCRFVIDSLKASVPIWKKEVLEDGEIWVTPHP